MAVIHGLAIWPGALQICSATYSMAHGITPGTALVRMLPQPTFPDLNGTLIITDGNETITLVDCKLDQLKLEYGEGGIIWSLEILDRRWKWRDLGQISGCYNQLDPRGKLIPWMIRSPLEMIKLCLQALGEVAFSIDVPAGLTQADGANIASFLTTGQNFPPTGVNPPVNWECEPPAQALEKLAAQFGRHVILDIADNSVKILKPGIGNDLPSDRSIAKIGPSINDPEIPDGVAAVGAYTRYQARFATYAVGEEWDGSLKPIDALSYAPFKGGKVQISTVTIGEVDLVIASATQKYNIWLFGDGQPAFANGVLFEYQPTAPDTDNSVAALFAARINASVDPKVQPYLTAVAVGNVITLTGKTQGVPFDVEGRMSPAAAPGICRAALVQAAVKPGVGWDFCPPPLFPTVRATDRLTYAQAVALAQKSVFKMYQLSDQDVSGVGPINIPGYGLLLRKQQVLLQDTQVDQIVPTLADQNIRDKLGRPLIVNFYNGYSRDKPAAAYGSVCKWLQNAYWLGGPAGANSLATDQIFVDFSVDSVYQTIAFNSYVYKKGPAGEIKEAAVVLETACQIRNPLTNHIERFVLSSRLPRSSGTNFFHQKFEDVQVNVTSTYDPVTNVIKTVNVLETDPIFRANYYLTGMALQYIVQETQVIEYNGIVFLPLDGAISQVTWEVGDSGAKTQAGRNTEPNVWIPPLAARRRQEMLRPAQAQKIDGNGKAPGGPGAVGGA